MPTHQPQQTLSDFANARFIAAILGIRSAAEYLREHGYSLSIALHILAH